jgi:hypothetical protein
VEVPQADLSALRRRLAMTQWPKKGDRPGFFPGRAAGDQKSSQPHTRKKLGMMDTNYLRDSLKAAGAEQASICKLCRALVNSSYQEAHNAVTGGCRRPALRW